MLFFYNAGSRLSSRTVSSPVLSAAYVLTVVFGMGTGVAHKRITAGNFISCHHMTAGLLPFISFQETDVSSSFSDVSVICH